MSLLLALGNLQAQDGPIFKVMAPDTVPLGERFEISFVLKNGQGDEFSPPDFIGFKIISGPNMSSSFSFMNGKSSQEVSYNYILEAEKTGTRAIEPAKISTDGKTLKSEMKKIAVVEGYVMPRKSNPFDDFFNRRNDRFFQWPERNETAPSAPQEKKKKKKTYRI